MAVLAPVRYVFKAASRDRIFLSLLLILIIATAMSVFLGGAAVVESRSFAIVFAAGGLRASGMAGLVLFVSFFIRRSFEAGDVEFLLSRPLSRFNLLFSYALAFSLIAFLFGLAEGAAVASFAGHAALPDIGFWTLSLATENIVLVNTALFFAVAMKNGATASMAAFGFYLLCRMMGQILGIMDAEGTFFIGGGAVRVVMNAISIVLPRLDLMAQSGWLLYGVGDAAKYAAIQIQSIVFCGLVFTAALIDFLRKPL